MGVEIQDEHLRTEIIPLILVGYEKTRHLYGLSKLKDELTEKERLSRVYVLYDNINPNWHNRSEENAREITDAASNVHFINAAMFGYNPQNYSDAVKAYTHIMKKESESALLLFDITNTTKESMLASYHFGMIFGCGHYYVRASEYSPLDERVAEPFKLLHKDKDLRSTFLSLSKSDARSYDKFIDRLHGKYLALASEQDREPGKLMKLPPILPRFELESRSEDVILSLEAPAATVAKLTERLLKDGRVKDLLAKSEEDRQASINYSVGQLQKWGFVKTGRGKGRSRTVELTEFGEGYRQAIAQDSAGSSRSRAERRLSLITS